MPTNNIFELLATTNKTHTQNMPQKNTSSFAPQIGAVFSSTVFFVSVMILLSSLVLLWSGTDWTLVLIRALYGFMSLGLALMIKRIPSVQNVLLTMEEDQRTIANHWAQDRDLIQLTWCLRAGYLLFALSIVVSIVLWFQYDMPKLQIFALELYQSPCNTGHQDKILQWLYNTKAFPFFVFGYTLVYLTLAVQFVATCHIILYRNTPTKMGIKVFCQECYKHGSIAFAVGVPVFGTASVLMASSPMFFPANSVTNFVHTSFPGFNGYGFPTGTVTPQIRNTFLQELPNYNPWDHIGPDKILDAQKQDNFIRENIVPIRKKFGLGQLQTMGIDPPIVSNYGTGLTKVDK